MKRKSNLLGIFALTAVIVLSFSLFSCGEEDTFKGPSIPKISVPKPAEINADIAGAVTPAINSDKEAFDFLTSVFSSAVSVLQMPDMSIIEDILNEIMSGIGGPMYNQRRVYTDSQRIDINFADYAKGLKDYGVDLKGRITGSFTYSFNDITYATSVNGNVNADCSLGYDISKNSLIDTNDVFVMDVKFKANGSMSMKMSETQEKVSVSAGAAASFAMAYKIAETGEGAKIILTAGISGSTDMDLLAMEEVDLLMSSLENFNGNVTLAIYDAANVEVYTIKMSLEDLMEYIETVVENI